MRTAVAKNTIRSIIALLFLAAILLGAFISSSGSIVSAQSTNTIKCDSKLYLSLNSPNTQLNTLDIDKSPVTITSLGSPYASESYNAIGYRIADGFIYGYNEPDSTYVRIASNGAVTVLGNAVGVPVMAAPYAAGDIDGNGYHNMMTYMQNTPNTNTNQWVVTDVSSGTPTLVGEFELTGATTGLSVGDVAFSPKDGNFYGYDFQSGKVVMIAINAGHTAGTVTYLATDNRSTIPSGAHGSAYIDSKGNLVTVKNNPGSLYRYSIGVNGSGSGAATLMSTSPDTSQSDGAACPYVPLIEKIATPEAVKAGEETSYVYTIWNPMMDTDLTMDFSDTLQDGRTYVADSLINSVAGGTANAYANAASLEISQLTVPRNSSIELSVKIKVPANAPTGKQYNQAVIKNFSVPALQDELRSDYPITAIFGDPTPIDITAVPGTPDTGFGFFGTNPLITLLFCISTAGVLVFISRRFKTQD